MKIDRRFTRPEDENLPIEEQVRLYHARKELHRLSPTRPRTDEEKMYDNMLKDINYWTGPY